MKLRRMGALFVALCLLLAGMAMAAQEPVESGRGLWTRWWVYDCSADEAQIRREFADIAAKGYRGVEVCNKGGYSGGLGTAEWNQIIDWVIDACEENDLALGLSYQNDSPIGLPSVSDSSPEAEIAVTKLVYAENRLTAADFEQTAEGLRYVGVPSLSTGSREMGASGGSGGSFVAVTAARLTGGSHVYEAVSSTFGNSQTVSVATEELDPDSMTRLDAVYDGEQVVIDWTLPADENPADYVLFVWFAKAGGSTVNIFSRSGAEALVDFWLENYMTERMGDYLQEHSIELFEDSIEISSAGDIVFTWSMLDILETLRAESGYDMLAYLPLAIGRSYGMNTTSATGYALAAEDGRYDDFQFWNEYTDILSDLFAENHVAALSEAFGEYNITYRVQAYSGTNSNFYNVTNTAAAAVTAGGIAEGETLAFSLANDGYDAWRALSGGVHMAGGQLVSNEYAAVANYGWRMTFADMADIANKSVAGGANHFINHGYNSSYESSAWPGYHAFSDMFSAAWDDRDPAWEDFDILSGYLNRLEAYASDGTAKLDLAFWHNDKTVMTAPIQSLALTDYGWSYECLNGTVLDAEKYPLACVTDGRLAAEGSAYQALVLYHTNGLDRADIGRLGALADEGLPVIFAGELPQSSYGLSDALFARDEWTAALEALLARENVYTCADDAAELDALLRSLGLCPAADNCCGYGFRVQYDADTLAADEANIDVIEGDNGSKGDGLRQRASFKNLFGKTLLSMEAATGMETYSLNWADVLIELSQNYSQGVNHVILHGSSYNKSGNGYNAQWPGWSGFGSGFADDYNARTAYWPWAQSFTGYMARTQAVLQSGTQKQDLAVFSTGWSELLNHGYCYDILSDALLAAAEDSSVSADGSIFSDGPGYRAVVISESELAALGAENREKILAWAAEGLPVFVIGETAPDGCTAVSDKGDALIAALEDAGVYAAAAYEAESLVAQHYRDETDGADYYLLYNDYNSSGNENMLNAGIGQSLKAGAAIETSVTLHGSGVPVELDAVTGEIFRLTQYEDNGDGTVTLPVALRSRETMIIGLVDEETAQRYASADAVVYGGESGRAALELDGDWALTIYSKGPDYGAENVQGEVTSLEDGLTRTIYYDPTASLWTKLDMGSVSLGDGVWSALEAPAALNEENFHSAKDALTMTDVSGVGVYTRSFVLGDWDGSEAAVLALEHRQDEIVSVSVNGESLGAFDNVTDCIDISAGLREGENEITVVIATTLLNRALAENEAFDGTQKHPGTQAGAQEYGLSGACIRFYSVEN